jgi:hypothetical protein
MINQVKPVNNDALSSCLWVLNLIGKLFPATKIIVEMVQTVCQKSIRMRMKPTIWISFQILATFELNCY